MKKLLLCGGFLLCVASSVFAQNGQLRSPMRPVTERIQPWDCELPAVPGMATQKINTQVGQLVEWCTSIAIAPAMAAPWTAQVDGGVLTPLAHMCRGALNISDQTLCYAVLPLATTTGLQQPGPHTLTIASISVNEGVGLALRVEPLMCTMDGMTFPVNTPLPPPPSVAAPNGNLQSTLGAYTIESRIGYLRSNGWHVEWDRAQFAVAPVSGGITMVMGWCEGK
jgi:hypothetical protein